MQPQSSSESLNTQTLVALPNGSHLELELESPKHKSHRLAICLHPWSWLGGQMYDPVLESVILVFEKHEYHVLRYNSRGVGKSRGWPSFTGFAEGKDLESVVQWALQKIPGIRSIVIMGYSHGSLIASLHPLLPPPVTVSHLLLSYPLGARAFLTLFNSNTYTSKIQDLVRDPLSNVLIIYGTQDEFTSASKYDEWVESLLKDARSLKVAKIPNGTHFWRGGANLSLHQEIDRWLDTIKVEVASY